MPSTRQLRVRQIQLSAAVIRRLTGPGVLRLVRPLRGSVLSRSFNRAVLGYQRPFASLSEACAAVAPYANQGHVNAENQEVLLHTTEAARPSDYAAMFHLKPLLPTLRHVFDLGGNVGNLFYCFQKYLDFPPGLIWTVNDLPDHVAQGTALAQRRGASQLRFTSDWQPAAEADLLIASGSLHYFEQTLPLMVEQHASRPAHILINRTPLTDGAPVAGVQDAKTFRVACMLYNRLDMIREFDRIGYDLVDSWKAAELSFEMPGFPEHHVPEYSGMFLRKRG
jgi:putative methyltransferase (TIGR04325 family)